MLDGWGECSTGGGSVRQVEGVLDRWMECSTSGGSARQYGRGREPEPGSRHKVEETSGDHGAD